MNIIEAQQALRTTLVAAIPEDYPILWDNRYSFDLGTDQRNHLRVELIVHNSTQKSLGTTKVVRYQGVFAILLCTREGKGTSEVMPLATTIISALQMRNLSGLQVQEVHPERAVQKAGWYALPLSAAFWFDDIVVNPD